MKILYKLRSGHNVKLFYFMKNYAEMLIPACFFRALRHRVLTHYKYADDPEVVERINYYCKLAEPFTLSPEDGNTTPIGRLSRGGKASVYFFDTRRWLRWFPSRALVACHWGDVTYVPEKPAFVKSRPIAGENARSVLLNLDRVRHFTFVHDTVAWEEKSDMAVFRGKIHNKAKRSRFFEMYFGNPICDLGDTSRHAPKWRTDKMTIREQLGFKFILALEGNDVASNLKWVMSSNSVAVMPEPEFETWFMEGQLIPNYHYVAIKRDFSDFEERIRYYIDHPDEAKEIVRHASEYVARFFDKSRERYISLCVVEKYLELSSQL